MESHLDYSYLLPLYGMQFEDKSYILYATALRSAGRYNFQTNTCIFERKSMYTERN